MLNSDLKPQDNTHSGPSIHTYIHTYIHTHVYILTLTYIHTNSHTNNTYIHTYIPTLTYTYIHIHNMVSDEGMQYVHSRRSAYIEEGGIGVSLLISSRVDFDLFIWLQLLHE